MVYPAKLLRNRAIVSLREKEGMSFDQIASVFGIKKPSVWEAYRRTKGTFGKRITAETADAEKISTPLD